MPFPCAPAVVQVVGHKYVRLYAPSCTAALYPFPAGSMNSNSSQVDLDRIQPRIQSRSTQTRIQTGELRWAEAEAAEEALHAEPGLSSPGTGSDFRQRPGAPCGAAAGGTAHGHDERTAQPFLDPTTGSGPGEQAQKEDGEGGDGEEEWLGAAALPFQDVVLGPGQMLYIPPGWWHFVRSLSTSFSVSFWWK